MNVLNVRALEKHVAMVAGELGIQLVPPPGSEQPADVVSALAQALAARGVLVPSALTAEDAKAVCDVCLGDKRPKVYLLSALVPEGVPAALERIARGE